MDELINIASTQGIWTLLSCTLIVYILKKQESRDSIQDEREEKYQAIIETLTQKLSVLDSLNEDIKVIINNLESYKKRKYQQLIINKKIIYINPEIL